MHCGQGLPSSAMGYALTTNGTTVSQSVTRIPARISAWKQLHGKYNFDAHPLAPLGIRIVMHENLSQHGSWAPHEVNGFYLGLALQHYRCYHGWVVKTQRERALDKVAWHRPQTIVMPGASEKELLITKALVDLRTALHASTLQLSQSETQSKNLQSFFSYHHLVLPPQ